MKLTPGESSWRSGPRNPPQGWSSPSSDVLHPKNELSITSRGSKTYRAFHGFHQAKFPNGDLVLGFSQSSILPQLPPKILLVVFLNTSKSSQNQPKNIHLALLI